MKTFRIYDALYNKPVGVEQADNGKCALRKFGKKLTSTGMREIHKRNDVWTLSTSYGAYFTAKEVI